MTIWSAMVEPGGHPVERGVEAAFVITLVAPLGGFHRPAGEEVRELLPSLSRIQSFDAAAAGDDVDRVAGDADPHPRPWRVAPHMVDPFAGERGGVGRDGLGDRSHLCADEPVR